MQSAGGLTIEQVLARSLRMPRRRLQHTPLGKRLEGGAAASAADLDGSTEATTQTQTTKSKFVVPGVRRESLSSRTWSKRGSMDGDGDDAAAEDSQQKGGTTLSLRRADGKNSQDIGDLFHTGLFGSGKRYPDPYPSRPTLKHMPKTNYVRTARDLSTHLSTCKRMGDWKDALATYAQASAHYLSPPEEQQQDSSSTGARRHTASGRRETPSVYYGHIFTLIDCLVEAGKGSMVEELVRNGALKVSPDVALLPHRPSPGSRKRRGGTGADLLSKSGLGSPNATADNADEIEDPSTHEAVQEAHADEEDVVGSAAAATTDIDPSTPLFPSSEFERAKELEERVLGQSDAPRRKTPFTPVYSPFLLHLSFTHTRQGRWPEAIRLLGRMHADALKRYEVQSHDSSPFKRLPRPPPVAAYNRILMHLEDLSASPNDQTVPLPSPSDIDEKGGSTQVTLPGCAAWEVALQLMDRMKAHYEPYIEACKEYDRKAYCARYGLNEVTAVVGLEEVENDLAARKEKRKLERAAKRAAAAGVEGSVEATAQSKKQVADAEATEDASSDTTSSLLPPAPTPEVVLTEAEIREKIGYPPVPAGTIPNGTTYALVMQVLEHSDQHDLADKLLMTMPEAERESIMASYSALIYLWSETKRRSPQFFGKHKR